MRRLVGEKPVAGPSGQEKEDIGWILPTRHHEYRRRRIVLGGGVSGKAYPRLRGDRLVSRFRAIRLAGYLCWGYPARFETTSLSVDLIISGVILSFPTVSG
jgi:hypothetical protein